MYTIVSVLLVVGLVAVSLCLYKMSPSVVSVYPSDVLRLRQCNVTINCVSACLSVCLSACVCVCVCVGKHALKTHCHISPKTYT